MEKLDFVKFIIQHDEAVFGKKRHISGRMNVDVYHKQIVALDIKLNELLQNNKSKVVKNPSLLLGLFAYAISQFGLSVKTDIRRYHNDFIVFVNESGCFNDV